MSHSNRLNRFPRVRLMRGPMPMQRLDRLERVSGERRRGVSIWVKRDDLMELGGGGNKLRKLEFLLGQAIAEGCDTVIVAGGVQSNFARLAAAPCARTGLACELVLAQMVSTHAAVHIGGSDFFTVFSMGGNEPIEEIEANLLPSAKTALDELVWWAKATMAAKAAEV
ncbi:pyridoxal-phosphate dependent enzyme [Rhizobium leguminosarum]|nr:pyridoxal-phosphate dependent enzyme [Rhizobium leguminosarum]